MQLRPRPSCRHRLLVALAASLALAGCEDATAPYVAFDGGGFIFNYRIAEAFYGVNLKPMRRLPAGGMIEVEFENPAGGAPFLVRETTDAARLVYSMRTPPVQGVAADRDYKVAVRVRDASGAVLATYATVVRSTLDQSVLPQQPLVVGPLYTRNPQSEPQKQ